MSGHVFLSGFRGSENMPVDEEAIQTWIRDTCTREGPISLAINLVTPLFPDLYAPLDTLSPPLFDDTVSECIERTFLLMKHQLSALEPSGLILNAVSHLALEGGRGAGHISAAHHAIVGLTQAAARSWSGRARLNVVCVGKQFIHVERPLVEDELLNFGVALADPAFRFLSGQTLMLDAGLGAY